MYHSNCNVFAINNIQLNFVSLGKKLKLFHIDKTNHNLLKMSTSISFNYYLFCMQQLTATEQQIWSEEDLASFKLTVNQYILQCNQQKLQKECNTNESLLTLKPKLERTLTVESPFLEDESTGNIFDLNGHTIATYKTQEEREKIYSVLIKKYECAIANKVNV